VRSFWIGIGAGCALLVVELGGRVLAGVPTVPELIQDQLILLLPGPIFSFVLDRLLYLGKPLFFTSLLIFQVVLGGLGGILVARWRRPIALATIGWLATGFVLLPVTNQGVFAGSLGVALVSLLAFATYALALIVYRGEPLRAAHRAVDEQPDLSRRLIVGSGLSALVSMILGRQIVGTLPSLPPRPNDSTPVPGTSQADAGSVPAMVTPAAKFYVVSKNLVDPIIDASTWHLTVDGLVSHRLVLTYGDILAMPFQQIYRTLECISNEVGGDLISNGSWTGVRLGDVLRMAGVDSRATTVHFTSADGYTENMPLAKALDPSTLLVYKLDGQPLPSKHGFPLRVLGTGTYGMKNPKWLTRIEVARSAPAGFWESQGWNPDAIVQTMSRIDTPPDGAVLGSSTVAVGGIAFAGSRGIRRVEVSTDGGATWNTASVEPTPDPDTWRLWRYSWRPARPGRYSLAVRAIDGTGRIQTATTTDTFPAGATGYDRINVQVVA
jgi:DMSO/TMAO reductase YedYZ molybdopterin-dependent catalytic subunit